jgi:hypothetical protein
LVTMNFQLEILNLKFTIAYRLLPVA